MDTTIPAVPSLLTRRGEHINVWLPEGLPAVLEGFKWPTKIAKEIARINQIWVTANEAHAAWADAHDEWEHVAPAADQQALEAAIRAGEPDPGAPATAAADRAEVVAWTRLQLALDEVRANDYKPVLREYLADHEPHLCAYEIGRAEAVAEAKAKAAELIAAVTGGARDAGRVSAAIKFALATRWTDGDDVDTFREPAPGDELGVRERIERRNSEILARWRRVVAGEPEPEHVPTATELAAAARYGSRDAAAELKRRREASVAGD